MGWEGDLGGWALGSILGNFLLNFGLGPVRAVYLRVMWLPCGSDGDDLEGPVGVKQAAVDLGRVRSHLETARALEESAGRAMGEGRLEGARSRLESAREELGLALDALAGKPEGDPS